MPTVIGGLSGRVDRRLARSRDLLWIFAEKKDVKSVRSVQTGGALAWEIVLINCGCFVGMLGKVMVGRMNAAVL